MSAGLSRESSGRVSGGQERAGGSGRRSGRDPQPNSGGGACTERARTGGAHTERARGVAVLVRKGGRERAVLARKEFGANRAGVAKTAPGNTRQELGRHGKR